ncbi:MAG TPA: DNA ligase D, partial [Candidatus Limnocylindrales bacterium]|nr:DNA ligase D [Candidatus Limnocylindrales bacterium]
KTAEPAGGPVDGLGSRVARGGRFVVQRHRATRLHYDFRLEVDGVLVSWAVPKGPTLDASQRRMAVHVEDHPIEYLDFEGVIPKGEYGGGDVIVWDWGTWQPEPETPDGRQAVEDGELKFTLQGEKIRGRFTIVRTSGRGARGREDDGGGEQWLLIHKRDDDAVDAWDAEAHPKSVKTGRTNDEVKEDRDAIWISHAPAALAEIDLSGAKAAKLPPFIPPMAATLTDKGFRDDEWLFEIKWDGYRIEAVVQDGTARIFTRNGNDGETYFPKLLRNASWIEAGEAIVDGEVVAIGEDGMPDFSLLQELTTGSSTRLVYQAFDLLHLDGRSLLGVPLESRKALLKSVLRSADRRVRYADHVVGEGLAFLAAARAQGLEGIVAKHRRSPYEPGKRARTWLKIKVRPEQELVVGGWTPGEGAAKDLGALVVGYYEGAAKEKKLHFAGKVGSGFNTATRKKLRGLLADLATEESPFDPPPPKDYKGRWGGELKHVVWTRPELVIRAELGGWTREGIVRQAAFKGLDEGGKPPIDVIREKPISTTAAVESAEAAVPDVGHDEGMGSTKSGDAAAGGRRRRPSADPETASVRAGSAGGHRGRGARTADHEFAWEATDRELAALDSMTKDGAWEVGGFELKLTNLDKVIFPAREKPEAAEPVTKRDLIRYFALIAPTMLPHLQERPLNLHRFPNGANGPGFWQKDIPGTAPTWLRRWREVGVEEREANEHLVADRVGALCWLGNQTSFEIHAWTSRLDDPMQPTFALIDIDPGTKTTWDETLTLARLYRTALEHLSVRGYPKTTGKRGIQVWIPIVPKYSFRETSDWVEKLSRAIGAMVPDLVSWEWSKSNRGGKARLDYTQNTYIKT